MTRNFLVRVRGSPAGAQGLRWDTEATRLGGKTPVCGSARIFEHKASFFFYCRQQKKPLKDRSEPGLPLRACSLHSWEFYPSSPAPAHKTKAFRSAGMLEPLGSPPPTHRSQIPQKTLGILHIQPGLLSDSPVWASAFSQHYFSTSLSGLNRLHYLRRHLTIFYHRAGTDQHRTGRGSPTEL